MKASDLVNVWGAPDNTHLTAKQSSFRLPVHVAAKISALCDLYPNKTRTQIVGDLLSAALMDVEKALPSYQGPACHGMVDDQGVELFFAVGPAAQFRERTNHHYKELEKELGVENPTPFYESDLLWSE
ncbi:MAG TPA: hypothetical protein VJ577_02690 [Burkholderiaceae bacterium]|nr:hypothetical protein [Burkholderiaceae bacterium]